jgi:hypothetical protein
MAKRIPVKSAKTARAAKSAAKRPAKKAGPRPVARKKATSARKAKTPAPGEGMGALDRVVEDLEGGWIPPKPTGRR